MWTEAESWGLMKRMCWTSAEMGRLKPEGGGCWAGLGYCLMGRRVWSAIVAAAVVGWEAVAAVVQVDAGVAAPRC